MILYYLDSSAWVKRYFREPGREWVGGLFEQAVFLSCSPLGLIEVNAASGRKRSFGEIDSALFERTKALLLKDWSRFYRVEFVPAVVQTALALAGASALRGADSVHLASALVLKRELRIDDQDFTFVASDRELNDAARRAGLTVVNPEEAV